MAGQPPLDRRDGTTRVLVVVAHPDDAEYAVAGTVARWTAEGREVVYALVTSGDKGTGDPAAAPAQVAAARQAEQMEAAALVRVREVVFLGYDDATLEPSLRLRRDLTRLMRRIKPAVVVCQDPATHWVGQEYINHPDHLAAGAACLAAIFPCASNPHVFPELLAEGLQPHAVGEVYLTMTATPDTWIDIGATLERKLAAWRANRSQIAVEGLVEEQIVRVAAEAARQQGGMEYAEAFKYLRLL